MQTSCCARLMWIAGSHNASWPATLRVRRGCTILATRAIATATDPLQSSQSNGVLLRERALAVRAKGEVFCKLGGYGRKDRTSARAVLGTKPKVTQVFSRKQSDVTIATIGIHHDVALWHARASKDGRLDSTSAAFDSSASC